MDGGAAVRKRCAALTLETERGRADRAAEERRMRARHHCALVERPRTTNCE